MASKESKGGKKVGAVKIIEKKETRRTPAKKVVQVVRAKGGQYKSVRRIAGVDDEKYSVSAEIRACENKVSALEVQYTKIAVALKLGNVARGDVAAKKRELIYLKSLMRVEATRQRALKKLYKKKK